MLLPEAELGAHRDGMGRFGDVALIEATLNAGPWFRLSLDMTTGGITGGIRSRVELEVWVTRTGTTTGCEESRVTQSLD